MASPFQLRPWPKGDKKPKNVNDIISRINAQPGGFRSVSEAKLREQIEARKDGSVENGNGSAAEDESGDDEAADADHQQQEKTVMDARQEFLRDIDAAHHGALLCQDFISLLLTKETPNPASTSLSTTLRDLVGIGTLGASKHKDSNITPARIKDDTAVATGWRIMGMNNMVESVVATAERLEKEMALEAKYWADVLAVSESGWAVCALPHRKHMLGVRFGFAEATRAYQESSIAALPRNHDGTARLEHRLGPKSQRIRVVVERNGQITGRSRLPKPTPDSAPLQDRVLEARNTIFAQELWHEINREARTLLSFGVRNTGQTVTYDVDANMKIIVTLEDLGEHEHSPDNSADNQIAEMLVLGLNLLLTYAHRMNYNQRSQAVQPDRGPNAPPYSILRYLISRAKYHISCDALTYFLTELTATLKRAGISSAAFTKHINPLNTQLLAQQANPLRRVSRCEVLVHNLVQNLDVNAHLTITPEAQIMLRGKSFFFNTNTQFLINLPNSSSSSSFTAAAARQTQPQAQQLLPPNPLEQAYPPFNEPYQDVYEVMQYVRCATVRAITDKLASVVAQRLARDDINWDETMHGPAITDRDEREARFDFSSTDPHILRLTLKSAPNNAGEPDHQYTWALGEDSKAEDFLMQFFGQGATAL